MLFFDLVCILVIILVIDWVINSMKKDSLGRVAERKEKDRKRIIERDRRNQISEAEEQKALEYEEALNEY